MTTGKAGERVTKIYDGITISAAMLVLGLSNRQAVYYRLKLTSNAKVRRDTECLLSRLQKHVDKGTVTKYLAALETADRKADIA